MSWTTIPDAMEIRLGVQIRLRESPSDQIQRQIRLRESVMSENDSYCYLLLDLASDVPGFFLECKDVKEMSGEQLEAICCIAEKLVELGPALEKKLEEAGQIRG